MASIIISGDVPPEVNEMVNNLLKGKIGISQFFKFLHDNNLETKVNCINKDVDPSVLDDFVGDTLCNIFCYKNSEHEDTENYTEDEENDEEEIEDNEYEKPELIKKSNEVYEKDVKDTVDFAKRLIDDYGDFEEDDIDHAKAVKLFHSLILLARAYRQRASGGDERFNIPNFVPENILKFIESLDLPTDKIKAASERGKSTHYKMKNYKSFEEFEKNMKYAYGIENVWKPTKEVPEWFESVRNMLYRKFYPTEDILIDEFLDGLFNHPCKFFEIYSDKKYQNEISRVIETAELIQKISIDGGEYVEDDNIFVGTGLEDSSKTSSKKKSKKSKKEDKINEEETMAIGDMITQPADENLEETSDDSQSPDSEEENEFN